MSTLYTPAAAAATSSSLNEDLKIPLKRQRRKVRRLTLGDLLDADGHMSSEKIAAMSRRLMGEPEV